MRLYSVLLGTEVEETEFIQVTVEYPDKLMVGGAFDYPCGVISDPAEKCCNECRPIRVLGTTE